MMLNKKFSKVLCAVLAFAMIVTMLPAMALVASADETETAGINKLAFSDIANSPYQREIGVLNAISVLAGDPEGTFRPGDSISRAEMAAIIVRIYGMEANVVAGPTNFDDVPADHWSSGYVNIASGLGVINGDGDGKFRPDDKVKYNEAVKMLVCVLGYGMHAQEAGGWPAGYLVMATTLGIDDDVINQAGEASRETVAKLVYNTIDLDYLEKVGYGVEEQWVAVEGRTLMSEKMKVAKIEDIVTETYTTSVFGEGSVKEGQVRVGNTRYLLGETDVDKYVGYPVTIYAKYDAKVDKELSTIAYYELLEEDVVYVEAIPEDIAGVTSGSITVYEDYENSSKTVKYQKNEDSHIFVNGVGDADFDISTLFEAGRVNFSGKVTIIDIDDDQIIDALFVEKTETIVVDAVKPNTKGFYIAGIHTKERYPLGNKIIDLSDESVKVSIVKDGEQISYKDLKEYDVVTYTVNGNIYNFTVSNEKAEGKIEQITSDDEYVVDGKVYEKSPYYINNIDKGLVDEPTIGDEVALYLDIYGQVAYAEVTASGGSADSYAYVLSMQVEEGFEADENQYELIMFTTDNEKVVLPIASKVVLKKSVYPFKVSAGKITSTALEVETFEEKITDVTEDDLIRFGVLDEQGKAVKQMIKYAASNDEITEIEIALEIIPFETKGDIAINTISGGALDVVTVKAEDNADEIAKINDLILAKTPKKYKDEEEVFTKTIILDARAKSATQKIAKRNDGYFALGTDHEGDASDFKWKGSTALLMPTKDGSVMNNDMEYFSSDALMSGFSSYTNTPHTDFEIYDCTKDGTAGVMVAKVDIKGTSAFVVNQRGSHLFVTRVGTGTDEDGEKVVRLVGLSTPYSTNKTSEATLTLDADTVVTLNDGSEGTISDFAVGDVINYAALPNGKVYQVMSLFSTKNNKDSFAVSSSGGGSFNKLVFGKFTTTSSMIQAALLGNIVYNLEDDGNIRIRLTSLKSGETVDLGSKSDAITGEFDPTTFTNYFVYDVAKKTLKQIEYGDIPMPEEISDEDYAAELAKGKANVYKVIDEEGSEYYVKAPKVMFHIHRSAGNWKPINCVYFDDGSFDF